MPNWYSINAKAGSAEIILYDEIGGDEFNAKTFLTELKGLGNVARMTIRINSPGGSVFDGFAIYNALKRHPARKEVWVDGMAASIASVIAMAGDEVIMPDNAMMMIHDPSGLVLGKSGDMERVAVALRKIKAGMVTAYSHKTGLPASKIEQMMEAETWLTAEEAVSDGFADRLAAPLRLAAGFDLSMFRNAPLQFTSSPNAGFNLKDTGGDIALKAIAGWKNNPSVRGNFRNLALYFDYLQGPPDGKIERKLQLGWEHAVNEAIGDKAFGAGKVRLHGADRPDPCALTSEEEKAGQGLETIEARARAVWIKSAPIRAEFLDNFQTYLAYRIGIETKTARRL